MKRQAIHPTSKFRAVFFSLALAFCAVLCMASCSRAMPSDMEVAEHIARLLGEEFKPEIITVTVKESRAYAEMKGATMSKIRIDTMKLDALLTNRDQKLEDDVDSLPNLIGFSRGELVLAERDLNAYFGEYEKRGFSNLKFDFKPEGFRAEGVFSATFLFTIKIRLAATGILSLGSDGVYLDKLKVYTENIQQPEMLTDQILSRVNPLIEWTQIPFKVEFKEIVMDGEAARMTGYPKPIEGGSTAVWQRP